MKTQRIAQLLDDSLALAQHPEHLLHHIVVEGMALGLDWREIVLAVDEAERRTGLSLHPAGSVNKPPPFP